MMDHRLKKWIRWLSEIKNDVQHLLIYQHIFHELQSIISKNRSIQKPSAFYQYLADTYVAYITIGIRRQVKFNPTSISLSRLLLEIKETPNILSRTYYNSLYNDSPYKHLADKHFDNIVGVGKNNIQIQHIENDLQDLEQTATKIELYADRKIAHHDRRVPKIIPKFSDVRICLKTLDNICCKYHRIFHATGYQSLMPIFQYDWKNIFKEAWIQKNK